ncbi:hypothetical protein EDM22_09035 [Agromyces tardus]|uniref:OmpR/PhoB-type domain-containing protein n=1 Tax=Agromyces tardus TaxID=2583849 RepID=A0A3M8AHD9_9MICO|nr:BTAD domain-containing putative transcriptional regulator [Agromyces tardus]RNB49905.1 hypothetical protein EDM22_09035 [Agromyces tardus]
MGIDVLGTLSTDDAALSPQERAVVAALAVDPGREVRPGDLAEACWGEDVPRTWQKQVQALVSRVRRRLGPGVIVTTAQGYALGVDPETLDSVRFEHLVERARRHQGDGDPERAIAGYERALELWRGPAFSDVAAWPPASVEAARLDEMRRGAEEELLQAHLDCGEHHSVIAEAERLVRAEPLSERRWSILAIALYRSGRQADALAALRRLREELETRLGVDPGAGIAALETDILRQDPRLDPPSAPRATRAGNPYKGLRPFRIEDAGDFFGREPEIAAVLQRLEQVHLVAVVGPSGSGKSSLVLAGVAPRLRDRGRAPVILTPQDRLRIGDVVIIDQFEDAFHPGWTGADSAAYCDAVAQIVEAGHDVILDLRSDALDRCIADPRLGPFVTRGLVVLAPPSADALRLAIEEPARFAGLRVEHGLTELVLRDAAGQPGVLPHLSHALAETWRQREGSVLTVEAYESVGGIGGAIARSAEELYLGLTTEERAQCQALLRRLVSLTPDGRTVQHRVAVGPLRQDAHRSAIIARLVDARLVSVVDDTITVAHESLATAWPRLHAWLEQDAEGARVLAQLAAAAESWDQAGRPADELYRGARLRTALEWRGTSSPDLTRTESDFLDASAEREFADERRATARARRERRQNRVLRGALASAVVLLVASVTATAFAVRGAEDAARERRSADIGALVGTSLSLRSSQRAVAALLAVEAHARWPEDPRTRASLMGTFTAAPALVGTSTVGGTERIVAAPLPGGDEAVVLREDGTAGVYDVATARLVRDLEVPPSPAAFARPPLVAVSSGGATAVIVRPVAIGSDVFDFTAASELVAVDLGSGEAIAPPETLSIGAAGLAVDAAGSRAAAVGLDGRIRIVDLDTMWSASVEDVEPAGRIAVAFLDDGGLVIGSTDAVTILDPAERTVVRRFAVPPGFAGGTIATAGSTVVAAGDAGITLIDIASGGPMWKRDADSAAAACTSLTVSPVHEAVWCTTEAGEIVQHDLTTGASTARFPQRAAGVFPRADGGELVAVGVAEPVFSRWGLDGGGAVTRVIASGAHGAVGYDPAGSAVLVSDGSSRLHVWDTSADESRLVLPETTSRALWAGDDLLLAGITPGGGPVLLDATTGELQPSDGVPSLTDSAWTGPAGRRTVVAAGGNDLRVIDPATGERLAGPFDLGARPTSVSLLADGSRLLVTTLLGGVSTSRVLDAADGEAVSPELVGPSITTAAGDTLVGAYGTRLLTYDPAGLSVTGSLPSAAAGITSLQASTDGSTVLATGTDGSATLFDLDGGVQLGDAIPSAGGDGFAASLRPDGGELAVALTDGLQLWDLDPDVQAEAACRIAGRDLTRAEWDTYLGAIASYRSTCGFGSTDG